MFAQIAQIDLNGGQSYCKGRKAHNRFLLSRFLYGHISLHSFFTFGAFNYFKILKIPLILYTLCFVVVVVVLLIVVFLLLKFKPNLSNSHSKFYQNKQKTKKQGNVLFLLLNMD